MKKKILTIFLVLIITLPTITPVLAISGTDLLTRLGQIEQSVTDMKSEYNNILATYPDVVNSLSAENKNVALNLANNVMADNARATVDSIKQELRNSTVANADKVLDAIEDLEEDAKDLVNDNKDIMNEVKSGYQNLSSAEIKQAVEKVKSITTSLGVNTDVTTEYNQIMTTLNNAHTKALTINTKLKNVLDTNVATFEEGLTIELLKELVTEIKNKDQDAVLDTLKQAVNGLSNADTVKADLDSIKADVKSLKTELNTVNSIDYEKLILFSDTQKTAISNKFKEIEQDYVDFARVILDNNAEDYIGVVTKLARKESVDNMINYANEVIDYVVLYKNTLNTLTKQDIANALQNKLNLPSDFTEKAGVLVALGFIDTSSYNQAYIENNFGSQIDNLVRFLASEFVDYIDYLDTSMKNEVKGITTSSEASVAQSKIVNINMARFGTVANIKNLKARIEREFLTGRDDLKDDLNTVLAYVYNMYDANMLNTMETIMSLEGEKNNKKYEYSATRYYIIADNFMNQNTVRDTLGLPSANYGIVTSEGLNGSNVKTGSTMKIAMSNTVYQTYTYVVLGDVYADGNVDARDYMAIKNEIMGRRRLDNVCKTAANTYRDSSIDARDYMLIKNQIMGKDTISL